MFLKAENLQRTGSFKIRGAYNKIASLTEEERAGGVVAFSSGNHAQAVALASALLGATAVIVMPTDAPEAKVAATRAYGAEVVSYDRYAEDREAIARDLARDRGLALVPPFDDPAIVAGQGTAALELVDDAGPLDALVVPVGGGGLIAGCALAASGCVPECAIYGVEPETGDDTKRSLESGKRVTIHVPHTIADGQQVTAPGEITFEILRELVSRIVLVSDDDIVAAMAFAFDRLKIVIEPSGASGLAALLSRKLDLAGRRVGVIVSGGNVGRRRFCELLSRFPSA